MTDESLPRLVPVEVGLPDDQAGLVENLRTASSGNRELAEIAYEALEASREALEKVAALTAMVAELNAAVVTLAQRTADDHKAIHTLQSKVAETANSTKGVVDAVWELKKWQ